MKYPFRNLVFEGAGVRNCVYAGALMALDQFGILAQIERVAGASSGSIIATLLSLRYSAEEIRQEILALDFSKLTDGSGLLGPVRLATRYGWHPGGYFLEHIQQAIQRKTGNPRSTFADLKANGFLELHVIGANLCTHQARAFPDLS